jgi:hypothetical protein
MITEYKINSKVSHLDEKLEGVVIDINKRDQVYPIIVKWDNGKTGCYSLNGEWNSKKRIELKQ